MPVSVSSAWRFSYNGLYFGDFDQSQIYVVDVDGLRSLPAIRSGDVGRPRQHGMYAGLDLMSGRTIDMTLQVVGSSDADFDLQLSSVETAFAPIMDPKVNALLPLVYQLPGQAPRAIYCRCRKRDMKIDVSYSAGRFATINVQFDSVDPRIYDTTVQAQTVLLPTPVAGLAFPVSFPLTFGTGGAGGIIYASNTGNMDTAPLIFISGPCINPTVENVTSGQLLTLAIALGATDTIELDTDAHTILLNSTASRRETLVPGSQWFTLAPTSISEVRFYSQDPAPTGAQMTVQWQSAWL